MKSLLKKRIVIKGKKVQDVGYRLFLLEAAESFGLRGFQARNVEDYMEFLVEGEDDRVAEFLNFAKNNYPELAVVEKVIKEDYEGSVMSIEGFYRSLSLNQLVKIVNIGSGMLSKQDQMLQKQDLMLEKQDQMLQKQDLMLEKQDVLINEVKNLRSDLKNYMEERFQKIELEISKIKRKIGLK